MWSVFFGKLIVNTALSKNSNWSCTLSKVVEQFFCKFFFDSRAKARLIHLDSFLKADFLGFFRKVKISLLSKNGFKIGLECLVNAVR